MSEAEKAQRRLNDAMDAMIEDVSMNTMLPIQKKGYLAMAQCCDSKGSQREVQSCINQAQRPSQVAQQIMNNQLQQFQNRLQRGQMDCDDQVKDRYPGLDGSDPKKMERAQNEYNACIAKTFDKYSSMVKSIKVNVETEIKRQTS
jgi:hypothetical protein